MISDRLRGILIDCFVESRHPGLGALRTIQKHESDDLDTAERSALDAVAFSLRVDGPYVSRGRHRGDVFWYRDTATAIVDLDYPALEDAASLADERQRDWFSARFHDVLWDTKDHWRNDAAMQRKPHEHAAIAAEKYVYLAHAKVEKYLADREREYGEVIEAWDMYDRGLELAGQVLQLPELDSFVALLREDTQSLINVDLVEHPHFVFEMADKEMVYWECVVPRRNDVSDTGVRQELEEYFARLGRIDESPNLRHRADMRETILASRAIILRWLGRPMSDSELAGKRAHVSLDHANSIGYTDSEGTWRKLPTMLENAAQKLREAGLKEEETAVRDELDALVETGKSDDFGIQMLELHHKTDYQPFVDSLVRPVAQALERDDLMAAAGVCLEGFGAVWQFCLEGSSTDSMGSVFSQVAVPLKIRDSRVFLGTPDDQWVQQYLRTVALFLPALSLSLDELLGGEQRGAPGVMASWITDEVPLQDSLRNAIELHLQGNYEASMHLCAPKHEALLRLRLRRLGLDIHRTDRGGVRRNIVLDDLISRGHSEKLLSDAEWHLLRWTLSEEEQCGWNIRHDLAHGLADANRCSKERSSLLIHLCMMSRSHGSVSV